MENVPGIFSSTTDGNSDFQEVLNELIHIKDETLSVSLPADGRWSTSGEIVGDGFSLGWRTFDAQFWGVAQRRRRMYLVLDFDGECAGKILFDESRLRGHPPQGAFPWQTAAGDSAGCTGSAVCLNDQGGACMDLSEDVSGTLRAQDHGHAPIVFEPGAASRIGGHVFVDSTGALRADPGDNRPTVVYDARGNGDGRIVGTVTGDHNGHISDYTALAVAPRAYGICSLHSNSFQSPNPHSGVYEADTSRTLDTSIPDPNKNAGGMAIVALEGNGSRPSHRGDGFSDGDVSYTLNAVEKHAVCYQDKVGALCASDYKFPQSQQVEEGKAVVERHTFGNNGHARYDDKPATLKASGGDYPGGENVVVENRYVVRRLTPQECALLQGFPPDWCAGLETPDPTEEDIAFWSEIWETHRKTMGTSSKPKSRNQIIKWLQDPHTDAKEYMLWGNGTALPVNVFVLGGIVHYSRI